MNPPVFGVQIEVQFHAGSLLRPRGDRQLGTDLLGAPSHGGETQARPLAHLLRREEGLEELIEVLRGDAGTGVGDLETHGAVAADESRGYADRAALADRGIDW